MKMLTKGKWVGLSFLLSVSLLLTVLTTGCGTGTYGEDDKVVRIGYQKFGTLSIMKARGTLEKRLEPKGMKVEWIQFPAGPQLLEAMNVGSIDIGHTGNTPPIIAQAAKTPLVYIGAGTPKPENAAIVVPKSSPIRSVKDLKGKKVALNKGSNVHNLLLQALDKAGLKMDDIKPVFLPPADARAAFAKKSVDAWVIWDPYYSAAEADLDVRMITDAKEYTTNREFILSSDDYAKKHAEEVKIILEEVEKTADFYNKQPDKTAALLSKQIGMDLESVKKAITRSKYGLEPFDDSVIKEQQQIADTFYAEGLIPEKINVEKVIWPESLTK